MGNLISSSSTLNPFSFATGIIGLVSFLFTLATAIRVFWENLRTISNADTEVHDFLPNLKQALYEERAILRMVRRRCRGQYEEAAFHGLYNGIRNMISQFKELEAPFVEGRGREGWRERDESGSSGDEKRRRKGRASIGRAEMGELGGVDDYYLIEFGAQTLRQRWKWLYRRSKFKDLGTRLERVQTRRIARQTTDTYLETRYIARSINALQDQLDGMGSQEQRPRRGN